MAATVVLLPGHMCDARLWRELPAALFGDAQVIHADLTQDVTISAMAARALKSMAGPLLPVGFSMGAIVAVEMARIAPERVAGLILSSYNAAADLAERAARRPHHALGDRAPFLAAEHGPLSGRADDVQPAQLLVDEQVDQRVDHV